MELIIMELFSLVIVAVMLAGHKHNLFFWETESGFKNVSIIEGAFGFYLVFSILTHLSLSDIILFWPFFAKLFLVIHIISIPLFVYIWMSRIEVYIMPPAVVRPLLIIQELLLGGFVLVSLVDFFLFNKLYSFTEQAKLISPYGIRLMMALSFLFILIELAVVFVKRKEIGGPALIIMIFSAFFLILSLILLQVFRQPYLFLVSSFFMLLLSYLLLQRKELVLDLLTRVPNNQAFLGILKRLVHSKQPSTLLMVDIENFRLINERYGEDWGDETLLCFATFLKSTLGYASVFRLGGNRFALLFSRLTHPELVRIVHAIRQGTDTGWKVGESIISFHVNIAVVETPLLKNSADEILDSLHFTMAEIKEKRRQSVIIFNKKLIHIRQRKLDILSVLRKALSDHDMVKVYYQPIVDAQTGLPVAAEALMRLQDERMGILSPAEFIPLAEQSGLITLFTEIILGKVCTFIADNQDVLRNFSHVSINVSAEDLSNKESSQRLLEVLNKFPTCAPMLGFEVTESMLLAGRGSLEKTWNTFQQQGIRFLLDDFGTGYSNLEALVKLPFDIVKIDRSVVSNTHHDYELLSLISGMLHRLDKQIVAEGVETQQQLEVVRAAKIHQVQGYFYSKPLDKYQFLQWVAKASSLQADA
ncbi:MAG TPA: phosphodiesterase [Sphaerochaeta sp.]|nr:phosphodiesterase [Sphaerochaeta sp.]